MIMGGGTSAVMLQDATLTKLNSTSYLQDNPQSLDAIRYRGIHSKDLQKATQLLNKMVFYASENETYEALKKMFLANDLNYGAAVAQE